MVDFSFNNSTTGRKHGRLFFQKILQKAVKSTGMDSRKISLSINLVGEKRMRNLNQKHRGQNKPTDVLSFPLHGDNKKPESDIIDLGDIFICLSIASHDAAEEGVSLDYKLSFLTVHGFLHLLGHDHQTKRDKDNMFKLQDKILATND